MEELGLLQLIYYVLAALAVLIVPLYLLKACNRGMKRPPGPPGWPIVGHLPLLGALPHQTMARLSEQYGPIYSLRLGSTPCIVVTSPDMAREFLKTYDHIFSSRSTTGAHPKYFSYGYQGIAFAPYGPVWRQLRRICTLELFTARRLDASQYMRKQELQYMLRAISQDSQQQRIVDFKLKLHQFTSNVVTRMVLNKRFSAMSSTCTGEEESEATEFKELIEELFILQGVFNVGDYIPCLQWMDMQGYERRMKALRKRLDKFLDKIIAEHLQRPISEDSKDMVDLLLSEMSEQQQLDKLTVDGIKSTVVNMYAGGTDTSTVTMEWAMSELIRHPHLLRKAQDELDAVVGRDRQVEESDIHDLKFLQAIIKETFRLHPAGPLMIPHQSMEACKVAGYDVPANTRLYVNVWAIGRHPSAWGRPLEFDPERFMKAPDIDVRGRDYRLLPFGSGRRGCPGISLGLLLVHNALASLLHSFDWSLPNEQGPKDLDMTESFGLTLPRAVPLHLIARPRLPDHLY